MAIDDEAKVIEQQFPDRWRVKWGREGYRNLGLSLETECDLSRRRTALLIMEHAPSWVGNMRKHRV